MFKHDPSANGGLSEQTSAVGAIFFKSFYKLYNPCQFIMIAVSIPFNQKEHFLEKKTHNKKHKTWTLLHPFGSFFPDNDTV